MRSRSSIRVFSPELKPSQISERLDHAPSFARENYKITNLASGESRTANSWLLDIDLADEVALEKKIDWALHFVADRSTQIRELLQCASRMDLWCSLFAQSPGEVEELSQSTITGMGSLPFSFELSFYPPAPKDAKGPEPQDWLCGFLSSEFDLEERVDTMLAEIEKDPNLSSDGSSRTMRFLFESVNGGLAGMHFPVPLLKRLADASVALQFRLRAVPFAERS